MKVIIEEINRDQDEEIIIRCWETNDEILSLVSQLKVKEDCFVGFEDEKIHRLQTADIYYFEAVDNKVFIYCKKNVYESRQKLYELESACKGKGFFRASKSVVLNLHKIAYVTPYIGGRFEAKLINGENVVVSRQYVPVLKALLGL